MMIKPELFAEKHDGHHFVEKARTQIAVGCIDFQYCETCDLLGYEGPRRLNLQEILQVRAVAQISMAARDMMKEFPENDRPLTQDIVARIWQKVKDGTLGRNLTT